MSDNDGWTPLHIASHNGRFDAVDLLLELGADLKAKGVNGITPLHMACAKSSMDIVKCLLRHSALRSEEFEGDTMSVCFTNKEVVHLFGAHGFSHTLHADALSEVTSEEMIDCLETIQALYPFQV
jgi:ankyrin repeat protein